MLKILFSLVIFLFSTSLCFAIDQQGKEQGTEAGNYARGALSNKENINTKLIQPSVTPNTPFTSLDGTRTGENPILCSESGGQVVEEIEVVRVTLSSSGAITVQTSLVGGNTLNSSSSYNAERVCINGYQVGNSYYAWQVLGNGSVTTQSVGSLNGCYTPDSMPATYVGGHIAKLYSEATGRKITKSNLETYVGRYYSGVVKDCQGNNQMPPETKYHGNPYLMESDAQSKIVTCQPNDPSCQAYSATRQGFLNTTGNSGASGQVSCNIDRTYLTNSGGEAGYTYTSYFCEPFKSYYPNNYTNQEGICYRTLNDRWDLNTMFLARCNSDGKSVNIEAWASWEGAPCGTKFNYGQDLQINTNIAYQGWSSSPRQLLGRLSVNKRIDGENTASNDFGDIRCYSDIYPLKTFLTKECSETNYYCNYFLEVENLPTCNYHIIHIAPPMQEGLRDGCSSYEQQNCRLMNEWWVDANGNKIQTKSNGNPTNNRPTSTTCKNFAGVQVCKEWWRKERIYNCESSNKKYEPDIARGRVVQTTADEYGGNVTFEKSYLNKENTKECIVEQDFLLEGVTKSFCESALGVGVYKCPTDMAYNSIYDKCAKEAYPYKHCPQAYLYYQSHDKCVKQMEGSEYERVIGNSSCYVNGVLTSGNIVEEHKCSPTTPYKMQKRTLITPTGQSSFIVCDNTTQEIDDCGCNRIVGSIPTRCLLDYTIQYQCESGFTLIDTSTEKLCIKDGYCQKKEYPVAQCKFPNPTMKEGIYCDINSIPVPQYETSRRIFRDCIEPNQCEITCIIKINDTAAPKGYRAEQVPCNKVSETTYQCPNSANQILRDCDCALEVVDPDEFKPEECIEKTCIVKGVAGSKSYSLKTCNKIASNPPQYQCPVGSGESIYQNCGCSDGFGLAAGITGAVVEALRDRQCE